LEMTGFKVMRVHTWSLEQNPYGFAQSFLNAVGFPRDRAYNLLKGLPTGGVTGRILDRVLLALLVTPAFIFSSIASLLGRGATMTVIAQKCPKDPTEDTD
jgi:hypothetical protein